MPTEKVERWSVQIGEETTSALWERAEGSLASRVVVLGHGAGAGMEHRTMENLAATFLAHGLSVVRFNFLYMEKKKGPPDRMPRLMECFTAVAEHVRQAMGPKYLFIGGHSMGGRTASMLAAEGFACDGLVLLSYPLHPAGQPEKMRDAHLPQIQAPILCVNGTRDDLCQQELMLQVLERLSPIFTMHWLQGADHGFHVQKRSGRTEEDVMQEIGDASQEWITRIAMRLDRHS